MLGSQGLGLRYAWYLVQNIMILCDFHSSAKPPLRICSPHIDQVIRYLIRCFPVIVFKILSLSTVQKLQTFVAPLEEQIEPLDLNTQQVSGFFLLH